MNATTTNPTTLEKIGPQTYVTPDRSISVNRDGKEWLVEVVVWNRVRTLDRFETLKEVRAWIRGYYAE